MSIWSHLARGTFLGEPELQGPVGALLSHVNGMDVPAEPDALTTQGRSDAQIRRSYVLQAAFTGALTGAAAQLALADGRASPDEFERLADTFREGFAASPQAEAVMRRLFDCALEAEPECLDYVEQARDVFGPNSAQGKMMMESLVAVAHADKRLHPAELKLLEDAAEILGAADDLPELYLHYAKGREERRFDDSDALANEKRLTLSELIEQRRARELVEQAQDEAVQREMNARNAERQREQLRAMKEAEHKDHTTREHAREQQDVADKVEHLVLRSRRAGKATQEEFEHVRALAEQLLSKRDVMAHHGLPPALSQSMVSRNPAAVAAAFKELREGQGKAIG